MSADRSRPEFLKFARFVAAQTRPRTGERQAPEHLLATARAARDEFIRGGSREPRAAGSVCTFETLQLLAAASKDAGSRLPELVTQRGFKVAFAYDEGTGRDAPSVAVLVQCPLDLVSRLQGTTVYLWNGSERYEIGDFDVDGKALGVLPAGIEVTPKDVAGGSMRLEEPEPSDE
jgi:hypothetical protein